MTREPIAIWGASGHARVVADAVRKGETFSVFGFIDDTPARRGEAFAGATVLGGREVLATLTRYGVSTIHVAIGHCRARMDLSKVAMDRGLRLGSVIHPSAILALDATIGDGTFVAAGAIVGPASRVGQCVILNSGCSVDHDCVVEDGAHIGPGVHMGGAAHVGQLAWIGIGATLRDRASVGHGAIVGAGAVVLRDVPPELVAYGVPARVVRAKRPQE
jgi:UDP-N-acetylbacillosamine N-acetyltransferase